MTHETPPPDQPGIIVPPQPRAVAAALRDQVKQLATLHPDDPFYAQAAEQLAAIVAGLEERAPIIWPPQPR